MAPKKVNHTHTTQYADPSNPTAHEPTPIHPFDTLEEPTYDPLDPVGHELLQRDILAIAQAVQSTSGLENSTDSSHLAQAHSHTHTHTHGNANDEVDIAEEGELHLDDDGIDPALRAIVNSLANAQSGGLGDAGLHDSASGVGEGHDEQDQAFQATLAGLGSHNFGSLFPSTFSHTEDSNFLLPETETSSHQTSFPSNPIPNQEPTLQSVGSPSSHSIPPEPSEYIHEHTTPPVTLAQTEANVIDQAVPGETDEAASLSAPGRRIRGRPKGSKNKPNPNRLPRPPKPPKPPKPAGKVGRPRKTRSEEEEAIFEQRAAERKAGVKRARGRPRMFPGHLVRQLRLKDNRKEFNELKRDLAKGMVQQELQDRFLHEDPQQDGTDLEGEQGHPDGDGGAEGFWDVDADGNLVEPSRHLDRDETTLAQMQPDHHTNEMDGQNMEMQAAGRTEDHEMRDTEEPSAGWVGETHAAMEEVFRLHEMPVSYAE